MILKLCEDPQCVSHNYLPEPKCKLGHIGPVQAVNAVGAHNSVLQMQLRCATLPTLEQQRSWLPCASSLCMCKGQLVQICNSGCATGKKRKPQAVVNDWQITSDNWAPQPVQVSDVHISMECDA